jgi:drug/metabolite transporter (DMT)-like permease
MHRIFEGWQMALHQASGHWQRGLALALTTTVCWSTLPVALKVMLEQLDPYTLTWVRFVIAGAIMLAWLAARGGLGGFATLDRRRWIMLGVAGLLLIGNYVFYLLGVQHSTPGNAQLLIQLAPLLMALGGILVFRERYRVGQWIGLATIAIGLWIFFRDQSGHSSVGGSEYALGSAMLVVGALVWAGYALIQKQLLTRLSSPAVMLFIYLLASVLLLPLSHPAALLRLDGLGVALLLFCALNTLVAYGAFAEALVHWEASRVSTVLAITPLLSLAVIAGVHGLWPQAVAAESVGTIGYVGAVLVVAGSAMAALLGNRNRNRKQPA